MQHIANITNQAIETSQQQSEQSKTKSDGTQLMANLPEKKQDAVIIRLFRQMGMSLGHRWTSSFGSAIKGNTGELSATALHWRKHLGDFSLEQIAKGVEKVASLPGDWWPTLQGFCELCYVTPEELCLPSADDAYVAAANLKWDLHPIVWHVARKIGTGELQSRTEMEIKPTFVREYRKYVQRVLAGEVFTLDRPNDNAPRLEKRKATKGELKKHLEKMRSSIAEGYRKDEAIEQQKTTGGRNGPRQAEVR